MSETLIPTMHFRWWAPSPAALSVQPGCAVLQQLFHKPSGGKVWKEVPWAFETDTPVYTRPDDVEIQTRWRRAEERDFDQAVAEIRHVTRKLGE